MSISIIIAHQNKRPEWLKECLNSIHDQDMQPIEIIEEIGESDVNDRINSAVKKARGKYILLFSDDDKMPPDFLSKLYTFAEKHNSPISAPFLENFGIENGRHGPGRHPFLSSLIRKDVFVNVGGFDKEMLNMADVDFWVRCTNNGYVWHIVPDTFYYYRTHEKQSSIIDGYKLAREKYLKKHGKFLD